MVSDNIIVTGFGPFHTEKVNASWECVKLLPPKINDLNIIIKEIPVSYNSVDGEVALLWKNYQPKLVLHVGVSHYKELVIETKAFRTGYAMPDCDDHMHPTGCCVKEGPDYIEGTIDAATICEIINGTNNKMMARVSKHAGRYLCEYIYYKSLNMDKNRTMFVHVPQLDKPYSVKELANGIAQIINCALKQLEKICIPKVEQPEVLVV